MSLGYIKGKYWVADGRYEAYTRRESYKALLRAIRLAGFTFNVEFSYTAQRYMAEIVTIERFQNSAQLYFIKHNNSYHPNPMIALSQAIRAYSGCTPLLQVICLELECEALAETLAVARKREALERRIDAVADQLRAVLDSMTVAFVRGDTVVSTARIGDLRGKPIAVHPAMVSEDDGWNAEHLRPRSKPIPAAPDEDDDL